MRSLFCLLLAASGLWCGAGWCQQDQAVAVGLFTGRSVASCSLSSEGAMSIENGRGEKLAEIPAGSVVKAEVEGDVVALSSSDPPGRGREERYLLSSPLPIRVDRDGGAARTYRGRIAVSMRAGRLSLVNEVALEDYLRGVLPAEVPASFHPEALKAQAIAARTYTLANLGKHKASGFDLCDASHCQVYLGAGEEDPRVDEAIKATAGVIVTYDGKPIHAVYHDVCGGRTAANETAWKGSDPLPYLRPVLDAEGDRPWCACAPRAVWTRQVSEARLGSALARYGVQGAVTAIEPAECDDNGRPKQYRVRSDAGEVTILAGVLRSAVNAALGWDTMPSSDFQAAPNGDTIVFTGRGNGHGVGLCQWGANEMAKAGKTAQEILNHYYQGVELRTPAGDVAATAGGE